MKLKSKLAMSSAAIALLTAPAAHASDVYISLFGGISTFDDSVRFNQTNTASSTVASHFISKVLLDSGVFTFTGVDGYSTSTTGSGTGTVLPYDFVTTASTSRTIGFYRTFGNRFGSTTNNQMSSFRWQDNFSNGFVVGGAFGMGFGNGWRGELELAYRSADVDSSGQFRRMNTGTLNVFRVIQSATRFNYRFAYTSSSVQYTTTVTHGWPVGSTTGTTTIQTGKTTGLGPYKGIATTSPLSGSTSGRFSSNGEATSWAIMANLWYDYDLGNNFTAIVGGGLGGANLNLEYDAAMATYFSGTAAYHLDDNGWGFAYQLGAGLGYDLGGGMMLSAQYRYFATTDIDVGNTELAVQSHNFLVGLNIPLGGN